MTLVVTWLWQGLAIAWITAAVVGAMPRLNAATRHTVWWLALAAVLAIPVAHGLAAIAPGMPSAPGLTPLDVDAGALVLPAIPQGALAFAAAIWAITAAIGVLRIARSCHALGRLKRDSTPFERSREARLPLWTAARAGGHRAAELRTSDCLAGACALGLGRPSILVSRSVADALGDESLDEIVMHEQAHLDRYDDWWQLLLAIVSSVAGLHPAVRFLARRVDIDREAACDDRVVSCTGDTRRYAAALLAVAAASNPEAGGAQFAAAPTATTTASALRVRVGRLLEPRRDRSARLASATSLVSVTALTLAVVLSPQMAPVVIFLEAATFNPPASTVRPPADVRSVPEPVPSTNVGAAERRPKESPRRALARVNRPALSDPLETAAAQSAGPTPDRPETAPHDSGVVGADAVAPVLAVPLPLLQPGASAPATTLAAAPWTVVKTSTASAAADVARAAAATGAHARSAGVSIGRFVARAGKAGASVF